MAWPVVGAVFSAVGAASGIGQSIASIAPTHRQCAIDIENNSADYTLCNLRIYTDSGSCEKPLPATLGASRSGSGLFIKTPHTARGSVGVFTYDLCKNSEHQNSGKMAVMFSNPYDFNLYANWFAVGVFDVDKRCDYDLYREMYYSEERGFVRGEAKCGSLTYESDVVTIRATMSDSYTPVVTVQVCNNWS
ncbi:hypothetical protein Q5P01_017720 [Channa striata]|uniref:DELTA-sagatoxin-Srs1a n=1 Tax=Channa striata TaxID=64152 RepID=A0AA88ME48_CHASR|nr:hypothetical protein Q5P01_017720 [Channa striata]